MAAYPGYDRGRDCILLGVDGQIYKNEGEIPNGASYFTVDPQNIVEYWNDPTGKGKEHLREAFKRVSSSDRRTLANYIRQSLNIDIPKGFLDIEPLSPASEIARRLLGISPYIFSRIEDTQTPTPTPKPPSTNSYLHRTVGPPIAINFFGPDPKPGDTLVIDKEKESMIKWREHPITSVMRTLFRDAGWNISKVNDLMQRLYMAKEINKRVSPITIQSQKNRAKTRPGCLLSYSDMQHFETLLQRQFSNADIRNAEQAPIEEEPDVVNQHSPVLDENAAIEITQLQLRVETLESVVEEHEKELKKQKGKLAEIEEIALATTKTIEVKLPHGETHELEEILHPKMEYILKLVNGVVVNGKRHRINVMLVGPAGSGKTHLAGQVARIIKSREFGFLSCSTGLSEAQILGRMMPIESNGTFVYVPTLFIEIWEQGGTWLFDEIDNADANTMVVLNTAFSGTELAVPSRHKKPIAKKHKDAIILAAANTAGTGPDRMYVGRNQLDEAFLDRFRAGRVQIDYSPELERYLCPDDDLRDRLQGYRVKMNECKIRHIISTRFLKEAYAMRIAKIADEDIDAALFFDWKKEEIEKVKGTF